MVEHLFNELGLNKREAKELVDIFFEEIRLALEHNQPVKLSGFGNFDLPTNANDPVGILKRAKKFQLLHVVSSRLKLAKN